LTLAELNIGQLARIQQVLEGPFKEKLQEMGCIPGVIIKPIFKAPFGDPIAYDLEEYTLSIRKSEARNIIVKPLDGLFEDGD
jgi:Fe2+ transport system protein FeoA